MAYETASREAFADAAPAALAIVLVGLAPVIVLSRSTRAPIRFGPDRRLREASPESKEER